MRRDEKTMLKKTGLWRGLAGLLLALTMLAIFTTAVLFQYASVINQTFGISTSVWETVEYPEGEAPDTEYYKSTFGEINAENLTKLEEAAYAHTEQEAEEGAVLLKNDDVGGSPALPLAEGERKVTLFGHAAYDPLYRTNAACTRVIDNNPELVVNLDKALTEDGFSVNYDLYNAYSGGSVRARTIGYSFSGEEPIDFYRAHESSYAGYNDVAIVMLTRAAGEGTDMAVDQSKMNGLNTPGFTADDETNSLALQKRERDMLSYINSLGFGKTIVLINTNYMMELDWLGDPAYGVDAALFIGTPGLTGLRGVADILTGEVAPSGRLVDTFAASSLSSPAIVNACGNTPQWANVDSYRDSGIVTDYAQQTSYVTVQQENIYVGYKYYETRYADAIAGDPGARSSVGSIDGQAWDYAKEMVYPFGYGLSYTTFSQTIEGVTHNEENNTYTVSVRVENTGNVPAKDVVQVYVQTPYGDYEKENKIEKSAVLFAGFGKTDVVQPGAENAVTVDVEVEEYLFASYDYTTAKGWVLTEGDYTFAVGRDAHDALNNILGSQGAVGLIDQDGNAVTADADTTYTWHMDLDTETYMYGEGDADERIRVTNQFDKMDINYWEGNDVTYLTRSDWQGTFPTEPAKAYVLGEEMETLLQGDFYRKAEDAPSTDIYAQGKSNNWEGVDNGLPFVSMRNVAWDNDEVWEKFIDQFDLSDLVLMTGNYFGNNAISAPVNIPEKGGGDGCQGVGDEAYDTSLTGGKVLWPCLYTSLLACTFNADLMEERGTLMANQALFLDQTVIWTGGGNLHRTPYGGRNAEYYSEDANLCYLVGSIELPAMEKLGILGGIKHFAANDQESYREGVNTFYTEQAFREGALRGFEGAIRKGKVNAVMQAFNRQGVVYSSSCYELNVTVLREEWGFKGEAITDASSGITTGYKSHYTTSMANGTDIYCLDGESVGGGIIADYIRANDDGYLLGWLRTAARHTAYALSRSAAINGLDDNTIIHEIIPAWQILAVVATCVIGALALGAIAMCVLSKHLPSRKKAGE